MLAVGVVSGGMLWAQQACINIRVGKQPTTQRLLDDVVYEVLGDPRFGVSDLEARHICW